MSFLDRFTGSGYFVNYLQSRTGERGLSIQSILKSCLHVLSSIPSCPISGSVLVLYTHKSLVAPTPVYPDAYEGPPSPET